MQTKNIKHQTFHIKHFTLYITACWLLFAGCGKKSPIGYDVVKDREGEIKLAFCKVDSFAYQNDFEYMTSSLLFVGESGGFKAKAFIKFKFDSLVFPESLSITAQNPGKLEVFKIDSINMDSLTWSDCRFTTKPFAKKELKKDSAVSIYLGDVFHEADSIFYIGFQGDCGCIDNDIPPRYKQTPSFPRDYSNLVSFYDYNCLLAIRDDTLRTYKPEKRTYVDTSFFNITALSDSLIAIQSGAYVTNCTLFLSVFIVDSIDTIKIEADSLRQIYKLDYATVNKAIFKFHLDTSLSYERTIPAYPEYDSTFCLAYSPSNDTLALYIESIVDKWLKEGTNLWLVLRGSSVKIARLVLDIKNANLSFTYSLPPKERQ